MALPDYRLTGLQGHRDRSYREALAYAHHPDTKNNFSRAGHALLVVVTPGAEGTRALVMPLDAGPGSIAVR